MTGIERSRLLTALPNQHSCLFKRGLSLVETLAGLLRIGIWSHEYRLFGAAKK